MKIRANQIEGWVEADLYDSVVLTHRKTCHTPVQNGGICHTITTRPGEVGVVIQDGGVE